jgi:hypothetical protein
MGKKPVDEAAQVSRPGGYGKPAGGRFSVRNVIFDPEKLLSLWLTPF